VRLYPDANIIIYHVEAKPVWGPRASARLAALHAAGDTPVISDLTRMECRVWPLRSGDATLLAAYDAFFGAAGLQVVGWTTAVCDKAAELRAQFGFKTPDALHLAAAIVHGCDRFLTHDARLSACTALPIDVLS
jgi:predicted nucleic acid-binding protein